MTWNATSVFTTSSMVPTLTGVRIAVYQFARLVELDSSWILDSQGSTVLVVSRICLLVTYVRWN